MKNFNKKLNNLEKMTIIEPYIDYVSEYVGQETDQWLTVKKEIITLLNFKYRIFFSRRHYSTKKHTLNELEKMVIKYWKEKVGVELLIPEEKLHPINWPGKERGWALKILNKERSRLR